MGMPVGDREVQSCSQWVLLTQDICRTYTQSITEAMAGRNLMLGLGLQPAPAQVSHGLLYQNADL